MVGAREPHGPHLGLGVPVDGDLALPDRRDRAAASESVARWGRPRPRRSSDGRTDLVPAPQSGGRHRVEDREVVMGEVPEHVEVGLTVAVVGPGRLDRRRGFRTSGRRSRRAPRPTPGANRYVWSHMSTRSVGVGVDPDATGRRRPSRPGAWRRARDVRRRAPRSTSASWVADGVAMTTASIAVVEHRRRTTNRSRHRRTRPRPRERGTCRCRTRRPAHTPSAAASVRASRRPQCPAPTSATPIVPAMRAPYGLVTSRPACRRGSTRW